MTKAGGSADMLKAVSKKYGPADPDSPGVKDPLNAPLPFWDWKGKKARATLMVSNEFTPKQLMIFSIHNNEQEDKLKALKKEK